MGEKRQQTKIGKGSNLKQAWVVTSQQSAKNVSEEGLPVRRLLVLAQSSLALVCCELGPEWFVDPCVDPSCCRPKWLARLGRSVSPPESTFRGCCQASLASRYWNTWGSHQCPGSWVVEDGRSPLVRLNNQLDQCRLRCLPVSHKANSTCLPSTSMSAT